MASDGGSRRVLRVLVSAAEVSSDRHAALVVRQLKTLATERGVGLELVGVGGPALRAEGLVPLVPAEQLLAMGGFDVLRRLGQIRRALEALVHEASGVRPDFALVVDYPDFHFKLAGRLHRLGVPVVDFIPPKVWVWRSGRMARMRELFTRVFCIFPFEPALHQAQGVRSEYVGNPLVEELPLDRTRAEARAERYGVTTPPSEVLAVMPGSRPGELKRHWEPMLRAAIRVLKRLETRTALVEFALPESERSQEEMWGERLARVAQEEAFSGGSVRLSFGESDRVLGAATAGLIKSGTSTLEAALLGCLQVVGYRPDRLTEWVYKGWIRKRYPGPVALVNLFSGWKVGDRWIAPEILMEDFTVARLERELWSVLTDPAVRAQMEADYALLQRQVRESSGRSPSTVVAQRLFELWEKGFA